MVENNNREDLVGQNLARFIVNELAPHQSIIFEDALEALRRDRNPRNLQGLGFDVGSVKPFVLSAAIAISPFLMNVLAGMSANLLYDFTKKWRNGAEFPPETIETIMAKLEDTIAEQSDLDPQSDSVRQILSLLREVLGNGPKRRK
ncbi:MAG: hypothetical protein AAF950_16280 [Pseudomonadota bacterium]